MNKKQLIKELVSLANELDDLKFYASANTMTRIASTVVAEDEMKHDPMVYNPDESFESEHQENQGDAYNEAMEALHNLMISGELSQSDFNQIESILSDDTHEMSFDDEDDEDDEDDDDMEHSLGLGAVPHTRIKKPLHMNMEDDDEDGDISFDEDDISFDDVVPNKDDERRDRNHKENLEGGHYFFQDEDDF